VVRRRRTRALHSRATRRPHRKYREPAFGSVQFAKLDPEHLDTFYSRLRKCRHLYDERRAKNHVCAPLAPSSARLPRFQSTSILNLPESKAGVILAL